MKTYYRQSLAAIVVLILSAVAWGQNVELKSKVETFYSRYNQAFESKNLEAVMNFYSPQFKPMGTLATLEHLKGYMENLFKNEYRLRSKITVDQVKIVDQKVQVLGSCTIESKKQENAPWKTVLDDGFIEVLEPTDDTFRFISSGTINRKRFKNINGNTYVNSTIGFSFSSPDDWSLFPFEIPNMQEGVLFMTPDGHTPAFFGYVQIPYKVGAKEAVDGDDAVMKKLVKTFTLVDSGPVTVKGLDGYQSTSRFSIDNGELTRKRVYLVGGGLLYVFVFNTPTKHWNEVADRFPEILDSFTLTEDAKSDGVAKVREQSGSGEILGRVYSNDELGCQIAAPTGWKIESTPLGAFKISISLKPPQGDSLVRLLAIDTKGIAQLDDIYKQELDGIKSITQDFTQQEEIGEIEIGRLTGKSSVFSFTLEGLGSVKRKSVMVMDEGVLFMILCDAIPPDVYPSMVSDFDAIIRSFTVN